MTIYDELGAEGGIKVAVDDFYTRVLGDQQLAPYFADVDMPTLRRHMVAMLTVATGGPQVYTGRDMATAHAGRNITSEDYDKVVGHLVATLQGLGVEGATIGQIGAALAPLKPQIVTA